MTKKLPPLIIYQILISVFNISPWMTRGFVVWDTEITVEGMRAYKWHWAYTNKFYQFLLFSLPLSSSLFDIMGMEQVSNLEFGPSPLGGPVGPGWPQKKKAKSWPIRPASVLNIRGIERQISRIIIHKFKDKVPISYGLLWWLSGKELACEWRRHGRCSFELWVRKIP